MSETADAALASDWLGTHRLTADALAPADATAAKQGCSEEAGMLHKLHLLVLCAGMRMCRYGSNAALEEEAHCFLSKQQAG